MLKANKPFKDPDFPHDYRGIHPDERKDDFKWKRARDIVANASTFGKNVDPNGIVQGDLGDCYFLAACSAIAERDERIKNIFVPEVWSYPKEGIYAFKVFIRGEPTVVTIDDYLPTKGKGKDMKLIYERQAADGGIWGPLLEKVWAKTNGYYKRIEGGQANDVFDFLVGAPSRRFENKGRTVDEVFDLISEADKADYIITCGTHGEGDHNQINSYNLPKSHAYSIINAYTLKVKSGKVAHRLFMIRNPYGVFF